MIKADEFQDTYDRDRRSNREKNAKKKLDTEMIGLVKRRKKNQTGL